MACPIGRLYTGIPGN